MAKERQYTKLPGRSMQAFLASRLWLASDHILQVTSSGVSEDYRRFYFSDIRGVTVTQNRARTWWNIGLLSVAALWSIPIFATSDLIIVYIFGSLIALFVILAGVNTLRGPTCTCYIDTAIQSEKLRSLGRVSDAMRLLALIRPTILSAQARPSETDPAKPHRTESFAPPAAEGDGPTTSPPTDLA